MTAVAATRLGVAADVGATHARFAIACRTSAGGLDLEQPRKFHASEFASLAAAYESYVAGVGVRLTRAAFAVAGPVTGDAIKFTNSPWSFGRSELRGRLGLDRLEVINDFAAIARALPAVGPDGFQPLSGASFALPATGVVSIVGPGSGLGVAMLARAGARDDVLASEGGHVSFAPTDAFEQRLLARLAERYGRVSAERLVCGEGLCRIYEELAIDSGETAQAPAAVPLWDAAIAGRDARAVAALRRWLQMLGSFAGDMALAHGAGATVLAGGILPRLADHLDAAGLIERFRAKGRLAEFAGAIPVALLTYPEPGLLGAATLLQA